MGVSNKKGLREWQIQRLSAVVVGVYALGLLIYFMMHPELNYHQWQTCFNSTWVKVASLVVMVNLLYHAWIGLWTVFTDYIKCGYIRAVAEGLLLLLLLGYFFWVLIVVVGR